MNSQILRCFLQLCAVSAFGALLTGCATTPLPPAEAGLPSTFTSITQSNGVTLAVKPITDRNELLRLFGADVIRQRTPNILPVLVAVTNAHCPQSILVGPEQFILANGTKETAGGTVRNVKSAPPGLWSFPQYGVLGGAILRLTYEIAADKTSARNSDPVNQHLRHEELPGKTLSPGNGTCGYVYFPLPPQKEREASWVVVFTPKTLQTEIETRMAIAFDWQ